MVYKPESFYIIGKHHQLVSIWKDLKDLGYTSIETGGVIPKHAKGICINVDKVTAATSLYEYKNIFLCDDPDKDLEFTLPEDYVKVLTYAKEALDSPFWGDVKMEDGEWYIFDDSFMFKSTGMRTNSKVFYREAYTANNEQIYLTPNSNSFITFSGYTKATPSQVKTKLLAVAVKKGFKNGVRFKNMYGHGVFALIGGVKFHPDMGYNLYSGDMHGCLYNSSLGRWSEVINTEIYKLINGNTVAITPNQSIIADGQKLSVEELRYLVDTKFLPINDWSVTLKNATFDIGCWGGVTLNDIKNILKIYDNK